MVFNITEHVQGVQYLLRFWRSDGVLNLNMHFYSVVFDLFCIFRENTHEQQLIQTKILYQCPSRNILDFVYGGSHFSTGVIFLRVRHVKNRPLWHFFYTWDTFFYGQGSFLYDEKWPLGRFSTGVVIRRYTGAPPDDFVESTETPHEGGQPPDEKVGSHHSPPDDVFKVIYLQVSWK